MAKKLTSLLIEHGQPLSFAALGVVAGIVPSVFNHLGEFWKWSFIAKSASQYGFWVIFVTLIIVKSKSRKLAILNTVLFCLVMCIVYGVTEATYMVSNSGSGTMGYGFFDYFLTYESAQIFWYVVILLLIPISVLVYDSVHNKGNIYKRIAVQLLIVAPLAGAVIGIIGNISNTVVVCADVSNKWSASDCTFQRPDAWIVSNLLIEVVVYLSFLVFWMMYLRHTIRTQIARL